MRWDIVKRELVGVGERFRWFLKYMIEIEPFKVIIIHISLRNRH